MKKILIMSVAAAMMFPAMTAAQHRDDFHWSRTIMDLPDSRRFERSPFKR